MAFWVQQHSASTLPVAVQEVPKASPMAQAVRESRPVNRWYAPGARVISASDNGLSAAMTLESDAPLEVVYRSFYFPGWRAHVQPQHDYAARLELIAPEGIAIAQQTLSPGGDAYPTSRWRAGEIIRSQILAHVPGRTATGKHTWRVTLLDKDGNAVGQADLASLQINAPQRVFDPPLLAHPLGIRLSDLFVLTSWDAPTRVAPGQSISVTLVWQSAQETDRDYKVFVHLLDGQGRLAAQSDSMPSDWTRPTSGWQTGEYVTDIHPIDLKSDLAAGEYRLVAGMYDPETNQRLRTDSGVDVIELGQLEVSGNSP